MRYPSVVAASLAASLLLLPRLALAGGWEEIYTADSVTVSKKDVEGSRLVAFKGKAVFDAPIEKVLYVLMDNEHRLDWVGRLYLCEVLEEYTPHRYVLYQAFALPAIFADRDYVYQGEVTRNAETGVVYLVMQSVEHPSAPPTVGVRAELVDSRYVLTPLEGGRTQIEVEIMTDPKGAMPAWLVNLIQRSWPLDTLVGIRGQLDLPHVGLYPLPGVAARDEARETAEDTGHPGGPTGEGDEGTPDEDAIPEGDDGGAAPETVE